MVEVYPVYRSIEDSQALPIWINPVSERAIYPVNEYGGCPQYRGHRGPAHHRLLR